MRWESDEWKHVFETDAVVWNIEWTWIHRLVTIWYVLRKTILQNKAQEDRVNIDWRLQRVDRESRI
jgi:hypothetical protein